MKKDVKNEDVAIGIIAALAILLWFIGVSILNIEQGYKLIIFSLSMLVLCYRLVNTKGE